MRIACVKLACIIISTSKLAGVVMLAIMDIDDTRNHGYGEWHRDRNKLTIDKIKGAN